MVTREDVDMKKEGFTLKIEQDMKDYLSCEIEFSNDKKKAWIGQPHLIQKIKEKFGKDVKNLQKYKTPGTPHTGIIRPTENDKEMTKKGLDQQVTPKAYGVIERLYSEGGKPMTLSDIETMREVAKGAAASLDKRDAMLGTIISKHLYNEVPEGDEGYLTKMRSKIVSRKHLNELGKDLELLRFVESRIPSQKQVVSCLLCLDSQKQSQTMPIVCEST